MLVGPGRRPVFVHQALTFRWVGTGHVARLGPWKIEPGIVHRADADTVFVLPDPPVAAELLDDGTLVTLGARGIVSVDEHGVHGVECARKSAARGVSHALR